MKPIELTEEHKSKLLEMCKVLFPEYIETYLGVNDYDLEPDGYIYFIKNKNITRIHWFEFCMTHLADKMLQLGELPNYDNELDYEFNSILQSSWWESHPVDYLYSEFKKLKL